MSTPVPPPTAPVWRLQDAKSQFSALVDNALRGVPQHVTRRGRQAVVVMSEADYAALKRNATGPAARPASLIGHLLAMPKVADEASGLDLQPREIDFS
ncbi:MAG: type II toxin-antitoxin system prevent-host-death family antitoxin [Burkholderiaceae bacterium]|jgi:prevent-host-death family protein